MNYPQSYTTGLTMPWKLLHNRTAIVDGRIRPEHLRLYPTHKCNARCSFCATREWANDEEIPTPELLELVKHFHSLGTRAITLAGGGEPTIHPGLNQFLDLCQKLDIQVGIITNGLVWSDKQRDLYANGKLIWARMSVIDSESGKYDTERLRRFSENLPDVAIGCYATITPATDTSTIMALVEIAERMPNVTHVKLAEECVHGAADKISEFEALLSGCGKVMIHKLPVPRGGAKKCHVSLLRPVVAADGFVYPCCDLKLDSGYVKPDKFRMCHWRGFSSDAGPFDGSVCPWCNWGAYNQVLDSLLAPMEHERFL